MTRIALLQMTTGIDPLANAGSIAKGIEQAAGDGAEILFTPEMSGLLDRDRKRAAASIVSEDVDQVLARTREAAARAGIWVAIGSLAIDRGDGLYANRSFLIDGAGEVRARYDKMHMFDVDLQTGESWRESIAFAPGDEVVTVADTPVGKLGLTICYDLRFPALYDALGRAGCDCIAIPAAFTVPTGRDHWHVMQRARAIEASAFVVAAAQVGEHQDGRQTYGHSLVVDPWGQVLLDMGEEGAGVGLCEIDLTRIEAVRRQVPSLANRRDIAT